MSYLGPTCDVCTEVIEGPIHKACLTRPSDPKMLCSVMWTCGKQRCIDTIGSKPDPYWEQYAQERNLFYEG